MFWVQCVNNGILWFLGSREQQDNFQVKEAERCSVASCDKSVAVAGGSTSQRAERNSGSTGSEGPRYSSTKAGN